MSSNLKKNFAFSIGYQILIMFLPFVVTPYVSRVLTVDQLGTYNHANSIAYYFFLFSMLGVNSYGTREIAKANNNKLKLRETFWQIYYIQFFLGILAIILYMVFLNVLNFINYLYYMQIIYLVSIIFDINWFAFGLEKFQSITIRNVLVKLLSIALIFTLVKGPDDMWIYSLIMTASITVSLLFIWPIVFRKIGFQMPDIKAMSKHFIPDLILVVPILSSSLFYYFDNFILGFYVDVKNVAYYTYANSLPNMLLGIMTGIISVLMSRMSILTVDAREKSEELFSMAAKYTTILNIGLTLGAIGVAETFIRLYLGSKYVEALPIFYIMLATIPFNSFCALTRSAYMIPNKMDTQAMKSSVCGGIFKIILDLLFVRVVGVLGICISSVVSYIIMSIIQGLYIKSHLDFFELFRSVPYYVFIGVLMLVFIWNFDKLDMNIYLKVILKILGGGAVYAIGSAIGLIIFKDPLFKILYKKLNRL